MGVATSNTWKIFRGLAGSVVDRIMTKVEALQTSFYLRFTYTYQLRNIETGKVMLLHPNIADVPTGSLSLLITHVAAREWLTEKDAMQLDMANLLRPNTKWVFQRWVQVEVKAVLTEQPLLGQGPLPDWLWNKYASDTFDDDLCLFRCIAVHQGAHPNRCTEQAKQLAGKFYFNDESQRLEAYPKIELSELKKVEEKFKLGIRVYEPSEDNTWRLITSSMTPPLVLYFM